MNPHIFLERTAPCSIVKDRIRYVSPFAVNSSTLKSMTVSAPTLHMLQAALLHAGDFGARMPGQLHRRRADAAFGAVDQRTFCPGWMLAFANGFRAMIAPGTGHAASACVIFAGLARWPWFLRRCGQMFGIGAHYPPRSRRPHRPAL